MKQRILVLLAHPDTSSFNSALADNYVKAAQEAGAEVEYLRLGELEFDPILHHGYRQKQTLEPDLQHAQTKIMWAQHLVIFTPLWWGSVPALLKGFIDRVFLPGWAFQYTTGIPDKLLSGRTAQVVATMDSPGFWYKLVYRGSLQRTLVTATLRFCGFKTRFKMIYNVHASSDAVKDKKLSRISALGAQQAGY